MKAKYILISLAMATTGILSSCVDTLNIPQHGSASFDTYYQTDEEAEEAITAVYSKMQTQYCYFYELKNFLADDFWCGGDSRGTGVTREQLNEYTFGADNQKINQAFKNYYNIIYLCNVVLTYVPEESEIQRRARAEAKVFRALLYLDLISMWGTPPLVDKPLEPSEYKQPNGDPAALWNLVETDLKEAIASGVLHEKSNVDDNSSYRITLQFAKALLGKAYVFEQKWADACTILDDMIDDDKYDLYRGNYEDIQMYNAENNCESIFELNILNDPNKTVVFGDHLFFRQMAGWRTGKMAFTIGIDDQGWGYYNPQKRLYDAFVAHEGEDGYRLNQTIKTYDQILAMGDCILDGMEMYGHEGYFMWKNRYLKAELPELGMRSSFNNTRIMRYAEVLLLAAEAHVQGGDAAKALEYINKIRERAQLPPLSSVDMEKVMIEKQLELCGESVRYQDMQRWGIAADRLKDQGARIPWFTSEGEVRWEVYNTGTYGYKTEKHELLPFPDEETSLNKNIVQNPGW